MIERLESQLRENSWLWEMLRRFDVVGLPDGWIVAGCIAQTVWNLACGRPAGSGIKDVDLVYFDPTELSLETEADHERRLALCFNDLPVKLDVKNQARIHLWYERAFGYPISPYRSTADAIASFPTTATAVGVRWEDYKLECCAPFGLDDLFALRVRPYKTADISGDLRGEGKAVALRLAPVTFRAWDDADRRFCRGWVRCRDAHGFC